MILVIRFRYFLQVILPFFLCILSGCSDFAEQDESVLVIGTSGDNPPFEFYETSSGDGVKGFDIELMTLVAQKMNRKAQFREMEFHALIPALLTKRIDIIAAGLTKNEVRSKKVAFSDTYIDSTPVIILPHTSNVHEVRDLKSLKIAAQTGTTHEETIHKMKNDLSGKLLVVSMNKITEMIQELKIGRIDGLITSLNNATAILDKDASLKYIALSEYSESFSLALRKDEPLIAKINEIIRDLEKSGDLGGLKKKWFLTPHTSLPQ